MKLKGRVLICDYVESLLVSGLEENGYEVWYKPHISMNEVFQMAPDLIGIIVNTRTPVRADLMNKAVQLKWIARLGSGLDIIDLDAADQNGIKVINSPEGNANAVAEHILGMLLNLLRNISKANIEIRDGFWKREENRGRELSAMVVGIIGFGNTGSAFGSLLSGFGCTVLAYDKYKQRYATEFRFIKTCNSIEEVITKSDVISLHLPLTEDTNGLVNADFLKKCKKDSILINSSRGKIVVISDLLAAMKEGHLSGACLDVFPNENLETLTQKQKNEFEELKENRSVMMTPHIAGWTFESKIKISEIIFNRVINL